MIGRNVANKMVIQYNSRQDMDMSGTSNFGLRTSDMFVIEYWFTTKKTITIP